MKHCVSILAALAVCFGGFLQCAAEDEPAAEAKEYRPLVKAAFAGADVVEAELTLIGELAEDPSLVEMAREYFTGNLESILTIVKNGGPAGFCFMVREMFEGAAVFFLPATVDEFVIAISEDTSGEISIEQNEDGTASVSMNGETMYLKQRGDRLFGCTEDEKYLQRLPDDGISFWEGLPERYTAGVKVFPQVAPEEMKSEIVLSFLPCGWEMQRELRRERAAARPSDEDDEDEDVDGEEPEKELTPEEQKEKQQLREMYDRAMAYVDSVAAIEYGYKLNQDTLEANVRAEITLVDGSPLAELMAKLRQQKPQFAGVRNLDVMHRAYFIGMQEDLMRGIELAWLEEFREHGFTPPAVRDENDPGLFMVEKVFPPVLELLTAAVEQDVIEMAAAADVEVGGIHAFFVSTLKEGKPAETLLRVAQEAVLKFPEQTKDIKLEMNAESWGGFRFHRATMRFDDFVEALKASGVPDEERLEDGLKKVKKAFGETACVTVGIAADKLFLGYGDKSIAMFKTAMEAPAGDDVPVGFANFSLEKWMPYYVAMYDILADGELSRYDRREKNGFRMSADVLSSLPGEGDIRLEIRPLDGLRMEYSLTAEKGVVKLLGSLPTIMNLQEMLENAEERRRPRPTFEMEEIDGEWELPPQF